ncbi:RimJ/RimL family protein N-acetyltransferase [Hydrogenispora ethanolica]|uniref:RimJ/RimL family protein N-acetyltransferase n=2 Tax=Hydrogenispora ethanolica TaxID=1082276 RepID=A0A4R1QZ66_HYDET|nr:RimJ/RimL family protein N-acetyltransferase [Hydrogenispora ethanolica]
MKGFRFDESRPLVKAAARKGKLEMEYLQLGNGEILLIREAEKEDASRIVDYTNQVGKETDNLTFGEDGYGISAEMEASYIESFSKIDNRLMLCAFIDGNLVGHLSFTGGVRPRTRHAGEFGITVLKQHWGKGIGTQLLNYLIAWAKQGRIIRKINLKVRSDNQRAIRLYQKAGFVASGTNTREFCIAGKFYDSVAMGLEID